MEGIMEVRYSSEDVDTRRFPVLQGQSELVINIVRDYEKYV